MESSAESLSNDSIYGRKVVGTTDLRVSLENANHNSTYLKKSEIESGSTGSLGQTEGSFSSQNSTLGLLNSRHKGVALPLLDLHKDHDADSLPSPTRDLSSSLPFNKGFILGHGLLKPGWPVPGRAVDRGNSLMHPYETDAVKAVSSYQQKFGQSSFSMNDNLPSPTPSEEGETTRDSETNEEVSSSIMHHLHLVNILTSMQPAVSSTATMDALAVPDIGNGRIAVPASGFRNPLLKSASAKSRDPRLRLPTSDAGARNLNESLSSVRSDESKWESLGMISSRKQKTNEERVSNGPALKRQKNELAGPSTSLPPASVSSISQVTSQSTTLPANVPIMPPLTSQSENLHVKSPNTTSLHSLFRDIAVNPSILMNLLKMEQQKSTDDIKSLTQKPDSNSSLGSVPSTTGVMPSAPMLGQLSGGTVQTPSQAVSVVGTYTCVFFLIKSLVLDAQFLELQRCFWWKILYLLL